MSSDYARPVVPNLNGESGLVGLFVAMIVFSALATIPSTFAVAFILSALGGASLAAVFVSAGLFWLPTFPTKLRYPLCGTALLLGLVSLGALTDTDRPTKSKPSASDLALVAAAKNDPDAENDPEAQKMDDQADKLETKIETASQTADRTQAAVNALATSLKAANASTTKAARSVKAASKTLATARSNADY